jgi:hypothetical protein
MGERGNSSTRTNWLRGIKQRIKKKKITATTNKQNKPI